MMARDLFDAPLIEGLEYQPGFISPEEERALVTEIGQAELSPFRFHGWFGNRKTRSFG